MNAEHPGTGSLVRWATHWLSGSLHAWIANQACEQSVSQATEHLPRGTRALGANRQSANLPRGGTAEARPGSETK